MKRLLFLCPEALVRTGLREGRKTSGADGLSLVPGVISSLARIAEETDFGFVLITNQRPAVSSLPEDYQSLLMRILEGEGVNFESEHFDQGATSLEVYSRDNFDLARSFVVGERFTATSVAEKLGVQVIGVRDECAGGESLLAMSWS